MPSIKVRLQNVYKMAYIALQKGEKPNLILNSIITVRVEMEKTKTGSFETQKMKQNNFAITKNFAI